MTTAVGFAAGSSTAQAFSRVGYEVGWVRISYPAIGYAVAWVRLCIPYQVASVVIPIGGSGDGAKAKRPLVDDRNDLQDLCEIWELMMRKAA